MESIFHRSIATLLDLLHWRTSIFWREIRLILYIGAFDEWYRDHWIISCCPHYILEHSHLVGCFDIETWLSVMITVFDGLWSYWHLGFSFSAYLDDLGYLPTFHFVLKYFTLDTFMLYILPELDHYLLLSHTSHHDTWPHTALSIMRKCRSILNFFCCAFIYLVEFRFNIFHDGRVWQFVNLLVTMFPF